MKYGINLRRRQGSKSRETAIDCCELGPSVILPTEPSGTAQGFGMEVPYPGVILFRHGGVG